MYLGTDFCSRNKQTAAQGDKQTAALALEKQNQKQTFANLCHAIALLLLQKKSQKHLGADV